jgi:hypothetical protein
VVGDGQRPGRRRLGRSSVSRYSVTSLASAETRAPSPHRPGRAEHEAVVLDRRAAAGGRDHDGVEPLALDLARPGVDVARALTRAPAPRGPCGGRARRSSPRPSAPRPRRQRVSRRIVASLMPGRAPAGRSRSAARRGRALAGGRMHCGFSTGLAAAPGDGASLQHRRSRGASARHGIEQPAKGRRAAAAARQPEARGIGQHRRRARRASAGRPAAADRSPRCGARAWSTRCM